MLALNTKKPGDYIEEQLLNHPGEIKDNFRKKIVCGEFGRD